MSSEFRTVLREFWYRFSKPKPDIDLATCTFRQARRWFHDHGIGYSATIIDTADDLQATLLEAMTIPSVSFGSESSIGMKKYVLAHGALDDPDDPAHPYLCNMLLADNKEDYDIARELYWMYIQSVHKQAGF